MIFVVLVIPVPTAVPVAPVVVFVPLYWKELEKKYHATSGEIYKQPKIGTVSQEMSTELKQLGQALVALICDWMEFNSSQINQGKLKQASVN